jgi:glyoxylase I family protein
VRVEHVAFNVQDPLEMARWYVEHLGFEVKRRVMEAPWAHFLVDSAGSTMIEIYGNTKAEALDFPQLSPAAVHLAFVSDDIETDLQRLVAAGGTAEGGMTPLPGGDSMAFVRDPWGFTLQLVKRAEPMI